MSSSTAVQVYTFGDNHVYLIFYTPHAVSMHYPGPVALHSVVSGPSTNLSGTNRTPSIIIVEVREYLIHSNDGAIPSPAFINSLPHSTTLPSGIFTHSQPSREFLHIRNQPRFSLLAIAIASAVVGALAMFMALAFT
ncbi:hypothetical protein EV360DRAFT_84803 [Lentinula raphanica]|nr:hypothetical protein EV360DRAFT_84803 [Lentinula raphanica]